MENTKEQNNKQKQNLAFKTYRFFTTVPKNSVLIVENNLTKESKVIEKGFFISLFPWIKTVGVSLDAKTYDFPPQVFQAGVLLKKDDDKENGNNKNFDIEVDAAITYRVKGGEKPNYIENVPVEEQNIKARNKEIRRKWRKEHGALSFYYDLKNSHTEKESKEKVEKQLQIGVYDALRKYVGSHTYEEILANPIDENSELYAEVSESLDRFGIEIVNFKIQNVNQISLVNEAEAKAKALEMESKAQADALTREAAAKAEAVKLQGEAEAKVIEAKGLAEATAAGALAKSKVEAFEGKNYSEIAAMNGQEFKNINLNLTNPVIPTVSQPVDLNQMVSNLNEEQRKSLFNMLENLQKKTENKAKEEQQTVVVAPEVNEPKVETTVVEPEVNEPKALEETREMEVSTLTEENFFDEKEEVVVSEPEIIETIEVIDEPLKVETPEPISALGEARKMEVSTLTEENFFDEKEEVVVSEPESIETIEVIDEPLKNETTNEQSFENYMFSLENHAEAQERIIAQMMEDNQKNQEIEKVKTLGMIPGIFDNNGKSK